VTPSATIRSFNKLDRLLLFFGILLVSVYVANRGYSAIYSHVSVQSFWAHQTSSPIAVQAQSKWHSGVPDFRLWSQKRIRAYQTSLAAIVSPPLGVLEISAIQLRVPVLEGTDELTLDRAVGHIPGTAPLGESGNIGIAGHRDGFFRGLTDVHVGETIDVYTQGETEWCSGRELTLIQIPTLQLTPVEQVNTGTIDNGNVLRRLSPQDLEDIAGRDLALLFVANHEPADNAVPEIRAGNPKDRGTRGRCDQGKGLCSVEERSPLRLLEEGKVKNNGTAREMPQPFLQFVHGKVCHLREVNSSLVSIEPCLDERSDPSIEFGLGLHT
jgi:sortase A